MAVGSAPSPGVVYDWVGLVFEQSTNATQRPAHGPQLCFFGVRSVPLYCRGLDVAGWDWARAEGEESQAGATWGSYRVAGTFDGARLTLTEPPRAPTPTDLRRHEEPPTAFRAPCSEPRGGWRRVARPRASAGPALRYAKGVGEFTAAWFDRRAEITILNVRFSDGLAQHTVRLLQLYPGNLCVRRAGMSRRTRDVVWPKIMRMTGHVTSAWDENRGVLKVQVIFDDGSLQRRLDARHGPGAIEVRSALLPVPATT